MNNLSKYSSSDDSDDDSCNDFDDHQYDQFNMCIRSKNTGFSKEVCLIIGGVFSAWFVGTVVGLSYSYHEF